MLEVTVGWEGLHISQTCKDHLIWKTVFTQVIRTADVREPWIMQVCLKYHYRYHCKIEANGEFMQIGR